MCNILKILFETFKCHFLYFLETQNAKFVQLKKDKLLLYIYIF
jgi:hypothetical protein